MNRHAKMMLRIQQLAPLINFVEFCHKSKKDFSNFLHQLSADEYKLWLGQDLVQQQKNFNKDAILKQTIKKIMVDKSSEFRKALYGTPESKNRDFENTAEYKTGDEYIGDQLKLSAKDHHLFKYGHYPTPEESTSSKFKKAL